MDADVESPSLDTVLTGDARSILPAIDAESIDLTVTSPPYNIGKDYGGDEGGDDKPIKEWKALLEAVFDELFRVTTPDGKVVVNVGKSFSETDVDGRFYFYPLAAYVKTIAIEAGFDFFDEAIWDKSGFNSRGGGALMGSYPDPTNMMITQTHEHVLVFRKWVSQSYFDQRELPSVDSPIRKNSKVTKERWREVMQSMWSFDGVRQSSLPIDHGAVFPEELPKRAIQFYSFDGDTVLDPFAGTGTTGVAAKKAGRSYLLIERNDEFAQYARDRLDGTARDVYDMHRATRKTNSALLDF